MIKDTLGFAKFCFFWGVAIPLILSGTLQIGPWFAAVQYYGLPFLFLGHFLYCVAGFVAYRGKIGATKVVVSIAAIPSIASGVLALSLIQSINPPEMDPSTLTLILGGLYVFYGLYLLGNVYVVMSAFKVEAKPTPEVEA
ncbi:MAG: hypothetical protein OQJ97_06890 [Rhodospirillales bacterium]|nr:hypothetical protein [Rhodospirillales bacterium]